MRSPSGNTLALVFAAALCLSPARAAAQATPEPDKTGDRPRAYQLALAGLGMALPTYAATLVVHEGTHALFARLFGAEVVRFQLLPGRHPRSGRFYFGYVEYRGRMTAAQRTAFLLAPKIPDLLVLGTYAALVGTATLPRNRYGRLALAVVATGFWVDFSKDLVAFWTPSDVHRALVLNGLDTFRSRLPVYALQLLLSGAAAYGLVRGYQGVFGADAAPRTMASPLVFSLLRGAF